MRPWTTLGIALLLALAPAGAATAVVDAGNCAACGGDIIGGRTWTDEWGGKFHLEHARGKRCNYCNRAISDRYTGGGVTTPEGRDVCNLCQATAVSDDQNATQLAGRIRNRMEGWGLRFAMGPIPARVVDQGTLSLLPRLDVLMPGGKPTGTTNRTWRVAPDGRGFIPEATVYVLQGMPRQSAERTIAHELMHVWMWQDKQPRHSDAVEEGVSNLAALLQLQEEGSPLSLKLKERMLAEDNPYYGEGMRRALAYVEANGFDGLIKMLRTHKDFPTGY